MPNLIIQELEIRIARLKKIEDQILKDEEKSCIKSRRMELESMKSFINDHLGEKKIIKANNHEFWRLVDEF